MFPDWLRWYEWWHLLAEEGRAGPSPTPIPVSQWGQRADQRCFLSPTLTPSSSPLPAAQVPGEPLQAAHDARAPKHIAWRALDRVTAAPGPPPEGRLGAWHIRPVRGHAHSELYTHQHTPTHRALWFFNAVTRMNEAPGPSRQGHRCSDHSCVVVKVGPALLIFNWLWAL